MLAIFFALSALPVCTFAQYAVLDAAPATSESTYTSQAFIPPVIDTYKEVPVDVYATRSDVSVIIESNTEAVHVKPETTTQRLPVVAQESTTQQALGLDTTAQIPLVKDTITGPSSVIDSSTRPAAVINTTTGPVPVKGTSTGSTPINNSTQPTVRGTTTQPIIQYTTTKHPIVPGIVSKQQTAIQLMSTELKPPTVDLTTTWLTVETTSNQRINPTPGSQTASRRSVDKGTTGKQYLHAGKTTAGVPLVETTTQQASVEDTTTTAAGQPVKTVEESNPTTKDDQPAITQSPTINVAEAAIASISSVSSQVDALIPIINKWTKDPKSLIDETNKKVEKTHDDIIAVIVGLGGKPDVPCNKRRGLRMGRLEKRGLVGPIGDVIKKLACMAQDLTKISSNIIAGNVMGVTSVIPEVKNKNDDLTEEEENKRKETKESTKQKTTKESVTEKSSSTEEPTTTEDTTTTTSDMIVCASGSCSGSSCPIGLGSGGSMPKRMHSIPRDIKCQDIPITTIDGPLPTGPIILDGSKRGKGPEARMFTDNDMSANPHYIYAVSIMPETTWNDQIGLTSGHFVGAPPVGGWSAAGVNGIYGCTAVLVVSNMGVYTSHIWENPGFVVNIDRKPTSDDFFETNVYKVLRDGALEPTVVTGISSLIGTDSAPGSLHSQFEPHVFVVTPFNENKSPENPSLYRYEARAYQLANRVTGIIPGAVSGGVYGYTPINKVESTGEGFLGRTIVEFDMLDGFIASEQDPTERQPVGQWRFWVEEYLWATHSFNVYPDFIDYAAAEADAPSNENQKRAENDAIHNCLFRGDSTATTSIDKTTTSEASSIGDIATMLDTVSTVEASADSSTNGETTETVRKGTTEDKSAEATTTQSENSLPASTPSTLITTTRASLHATTHTHKSITPGRPLPRGLYKLKIHTLHQYLP